MKLRGYQQSIFNQVISSEDNLLIQLDTGAGKTPIIAKLAEHYERAIIVCHRNILIKQASEKLALCGIEHRIVAGREIKRISANNNFAKSGRHFLNPKSKVVLLSIDTFISRYEHNGQPFKYLPEVVLIDEAHHFAEDNKWDKLREAAKCRCIGFTATPVRGDGQPLVKAAGGFFDRIVQAEGYEKNGTERLISEGYLAQYTAFYAKGEKGQSNSKGVFLADDAVNAYLKFGQDKQALVIHPRKLNAEWSCDAFKEKKIAAAVIHSGIPQHEIDRILSLFKEKVIRVLIAVDMVSEGFDVPDCDVLILARRVGSFGLYRQLCGRVLRPREGKRAIIVDLNGDSIARHGLPSDPVDWNAHQGRKRRRNLTVCKGCGAFYKATDNRCPECGEAERLFGSGTCIYLKEYLFTAEMVEAARKRIRISEEERLKRELKEREVEEFKSKYQDVRINFPDDIVGQRLSELFNTLREELKKKLDCYRFNTFFKKNRDQLCSIELYSSVNPSIWRKKPEEAALAIYRRYQ